LSAVYGATVLYWLGDTSDRPQATWDFLDRRIEKVMQFEKLKAGVPGKSAGQGLGGRALQDSGKDSRPRLRDDLPGRHRMKQSESSP
jgi:ubiquinone biosynthesis protein COQ9